MTSEFNQPRIHYVDLEVLANTVGYVNQELLKVSRPTLVDYIWIGEESATVNGPVPAGLLAIGQHTSQLANFTLNWWVSDRGRTALRQRLPVFYDNYIDATRTANIIPAVLPANATTQGVLLWRFRQPWRLIQGNSFTVDFAYTTGDLGVVPAVPAFAAAPNGLDLVFYGVGVRTRHRRIFEMTVPWPGAAPLTGSFTQAEFISNMSDEPYDLHEMQIRTLGAGWTDLRQFNMLRWRIHPSQSEPFSDDLVPILAYGVDQGPVGRCLYYEPTGGPLLLEPGQSIGWEVQNNNAAGGADILFQAALIGRTAPNL